MMRLFFRLVRALLTPMILFYDRAFQPRSLERAPEQQARVDEATRAMVLYQFEACPFCVKARRAIKRLGLKVELRDASPGTPAAEELEREGGELQVPCLRIAQPDGTVRWLYESDDIIEYLGSRFGEQPALPSRAS